MQQIREKIRNFSGGFKICFSILFIVYIGFWIFSIHLSGVQEDKNITPLIPVMYQDSHEYADLAQSLLQEKSFSQNGKIETFRVPGYPAFVAFFYSFGGYFFVTLIQIILVFLSALLIREIGIIFSGRKVGELAAVIFLVSPVVLVLSLIILTDILFLFLLLLGFYLAVSLDPNRFWRRVVLASVVFSLAIYVRPMGVFALPIFLAPFLTSRLSWKDKLKSIGVLVLILVVLLSPWVFRNYKITGVAGFSSFKGMNLACCAVSLYLANANGTSHAVEMERIAEGSRVPQENWREMRSSAPLSEYTQGIILEHPFSYAKYHLTASLPFLFSSSLEEARYQYRAAMGLPIQGGRGVIHDLLSGNFKVFFEGLMSVWWKMAERILLVLIYLVALFGFWKNRRNPMVWALAFIPFYLMALAGPAAHVRYAVQGLPFILLLFSVGTGYFKKN